MSSAEDKPYRISPHHDPDLINLNGDELVTALMALCVCGHKRADHIAATGALGSFGGSACDLCWTCATFRPRTAR